MKKGKIISFFIAIFMIISSLPIRVYAQQNPSLTVTAVKENEEPCSNVYFSIFLNNQLIKKKKKPTVQGKLFFQILKRESIHWCKIRHRTDMKYRISGR